MSTTKAMKWTPATMIKRDDNIISSDYTNTRGQKFVPSYEKEEVNMSCLLAMEYGRMWAQERSAMERVVLSTVDNDFLVRRYVIRGLLVKKKKQEQFARFTMKKFKNVPPKIIAHTPEELERLKSKLTKKEEEEMIAKIKAEKH